MQPLWIRIFPARHKGINKMIDNFDWIYTSRDFVPLLYLVIRPSIHISHKLSAKDEYKSFFGRLKKYRNSERLFGWEGFENF